MQLEDQRKTRSAYIALINRAHTGLPLKSLYDEKRCHEAHTFDFNGSPFTIYRIRSGDIRIYFCYLPDKTIVLLKTQTKRKDNLTRGEKNKLEDIARNVLEYSDPSHFMPRVI